MGRTILLLMAEAIVTLGIGVYLYREPTSKTLGEVALILGSFLVINRATLAAEFSLTIKEYTEKINALYEKLLVPIDIMRQTLDLSTRADIGSINQMSSAYLAIQEPKLSTERKKIVDNAITMLRDLKSSMRTPILEEPDFYAWLYREFDSAKAGTHIKIVSVDEQLEWTDTPQEREYFTKNVTAARRGVIVERIFLFSSDRLAEAAENRFIHSHRAGSESRLLGRYVNRDAFHRIAQSAMRDAGQGFIVFDDHFAIVDVFADDGRARGYVTFNVADVGKFIETFERFKNLSAPLTFGKAAGSRK